MYIGKTAIARMMRKQELPLQPPPPSPLEAGPSAPAPGPNYVYTPGIWVFRQTRYVWQPGFWVLVRPGAVWVPPTYVWTPGGFLFISGYWDYPLAARGFLFAPVYFPRTVWAPGFVYRPAFVVGFGPVPSVSTLYCKPSGSVCTSGLVLFCARKASPSFLFFSPSSLRLASRRVRNSV